MKLKKWVYLHLDGCGKPAFSLNYEPKQGKVMRSDGAFDLAGKPVQQGSVVRCGSCGEALRPMLHFVMSSKVYMEDQGAL